MQITELVNDGLKRTYACTIAAAQLDAPYESRLAEIAKTVRVQGFRAGAVPVPVVKQRFGAAVLGEVLEEAIAQGKRQLVERLDLKPAAPPRVEVSNFAEGRDLEFLVHLEVLPEVPIPDFSGIALERLRAEPTSEAVERALAALAMRHGELVQVDPRPAAPGDTLVCDFVGRVPANLLINGAGIGALPGVPGIVPRDWSVHLPEGLDQAIAATGIERGLPWFDLAVTGTARAGGSMLIFPAGQQGVPAKAGSVMTLAIAARLAKGALPDGAAARFGFNLRSKNDFIAPLRAPATLTGADRVTSTLPGDPALAYARPVLEIALPAGATADFTLRIGTARAHAGRDEPPAWAMPDGSARDVAIELGGRGFVPGFAEQLEGLAPGNSRDVEIVFPADYVSTHLAGAQVRFSVTAKALKVRRPRTIDDDLAHAVGAASLDDLRRSVCDALRRDYEALSRRRLRAALLDRLSDMARFPVPQGIMDTKSARPHKTDWAQPDPGRPHEPQQNELAQGMEASQHAMAERRIRLALLLMEIGRANGIEVDSRDMDLAIRREAKRFAGQEKQMLEFFSRNPEAAENLRLPLLEEKVIDFLLERVTVEVRDVAPEALVAGVD